MKYKSDFLLGASTAAHQVEGNNKNSDFWALEQQKYSTFKEPSLLTCDHYNRYEEDLNLMKEANLNAYRFSIEWARIEPTEGFFDDQEMAHYIDVIKACHDRGIEPIVTLHHFTSPKWLIEKGGWENPEVIQYFKRYTAFVVNEIQSLVQYICTINEANMGLQITKIMNNRKTKLSNAQVGLTLPKEFLLGMEEAKEIFGVSSINHFLSPRTKTGDQIICDTHVEARKIIKQINPAIKVGITLSLHDFQAQPGCEEFTQLEWDEEFTHYLPYIKDDDFFGLQNYSRKIIGENGKVITPENGTFTDMGYENYPQALANVIRKVAEDIDMPILVTENGISTTKDSDRVTFIEKALDGVHSCLKDGINVIGYTHWSLLDNFEWMLGYAQQFGLIEVNHQTLKRTLKPSLHYLGSFR
ncbi:MAG: glycoside hydrolase family 1 protein [Candidatus Izemoplasmataceae bacterium]